MCNQDHHHSHDRERFAIGRYRQIGRRSFLAKMGKGTFALLTEINLGAARNVLAIAIGSTSLAACATPPPGSTPTQAALPTETVPTLATATASPAPATTATAELTPAATSAATTVATLSPATFLPVNLGFVNAYVLVRGNEVAVVDTGVANSADKINTVIESAGRGWPDVRHVILTHYHGDHVGSMNQVMAASTNATAYAGAEDIPQIQTSVPIQAVADGAEVFGLQIIATPGHTPGHISVYDPLVSVLVAGDALSNNNQLSGSPPQFTADMAMANESVRKLAELMFETAYFGHGMPIETGASEAVAKLSATLK